MRLFNGNNLDVLRTISENSLDSIVTDPPYGLSFMNKKWDHDVPSVEFWRECLRVLKPGGHVLSFGGTRTYHRMAVAIEDAGFEIRDCLQWNFGSGFPKSHNIYKSAQKRGLICQCEIKYNNEDLSRLQAEVAAQKPLSESQKQNMLERVFGKTDINAEKGGSWENNGANDNRMLSLSKENREEKLLAQENQQPNVLLRVQRDIEGQGMDDSRLQGCESENTAEFQEGCSEGRKEPCLEGRNHLQEKQRQLCGPEVRQVSKRIPSDGEERRLCNGTQTDNGSVDRPSVDEKRNSSSQGSCHSQQLQDELGIMALQSKPQDSREWLSECPECKKPYIEDGFGTALKPANEPIVLARKPLSEKTIVDNVLKWGTGALNIDGCRVETSEKLQSGRHTTGNQQGPSGYKTTNRTEYVQNNEGRFPANIILDEEAGAALDEQSGLIRARNGYGVKGQTGGGTGSSYTMTKCDPNKSQKVIRESENGTLAGASRFFYCAKASKSERNAGMPENQTNGHPTIKPIKLMTYLVRLVTPPGGTVLDPFMGSGSTGIACKNEGFDFVGIELEPEYFKIAEKRIEKITKKEIGK